MKNQLKNLKFVAALAMLAAISIVCGKYLGINVGEFMRFSLESMPIIFAGIAFGPVAGAAVGIIADLVGCVMVGWMPIPWVTVGAAVIGVVSGGINILLKKSTLPSWLKTAIVVFSAHLMGSVLIKTIGLADFYHMPYIVLMLWRMLNYLIVGIIDGTIIYILMKNKGIRIQIKEFGGKDI